MPSEVKVCFFAKLLFLNKMCVCVFFRLVGYLNILYIVDIRKMWKSAFWEDYKKQSIFWFSPAPPAMSSQHIQPGCCHVWPLGWSAAAQNYCPKSPHRSLMHKPIKRQTAEGDERQRWLTTTHKKIAFVSVSACMGMCVWERRSFDLTLPYSKYCKSDIPSHDSSGVQENKITFIDYFCGSGKEVVTWTVNHNDWVSFNLFFLTFFGF